MPRPSVSRLTDRRLAPWLVAGLTLALTLPGLSREDYNGDESNWMYEGHSAWSHLRSGDLGAAYWSERNFLFGALSPAVSKIAIGIGMDLMGADAPEPGLRKERPDPRTLAAGRLSTPFAAAVAAAAFFWIARRSIGAGSAWLATVTLSTSPVWFAASRRAMTDMHAVAATLVALALAILLRDALTRGKPLPVVGVRVVLAGVAAGLAVGSKFTAAGAMLGIGALFVLDAIREPDATARGRGRGRALGAGAGLAAVAIATFAGTYPFLRDAPIERLGEILREWDHIHSTRVESKLGKFAQAYEPGLHSLREIAGVTALPGPRASLLLLIPLAAAVAGRISAGGLPGAGRLSETDRPPAIARLRDPLVVWASLLPAAVAGLVDPGRIAHSWIAWVGIVGGAAVALAPGGLRAPDRAPNGHDSSGPAPLPGPSSAALALAFAAAGSLVLLAKTTYITWPRYFLPLYPALHVLAFAALGSLGRRIADPAGRAFLGAAIGTGWLAVLVHFPEYGSAKLQRIATEGWGTPGGALTLVSLACFLAAIGRGLAGGPPWRRFDEDAPEESATA